jgi:hypothetical protein
VGPERISPTAHYTGQCWLRNGLSHPALGTPQGQVLYDGLRPFNAVAARIGAPTLEGMLLARHRHIDRVLDEAIAGAAYARWWRSPPACRRGAGILPAGTAMR